MIKTLMIASSLCLVGCASTSSNKFQRSARSNPHDTNIPTVLKSKSSKTSAAHNIVIRYANPPLTAVEKSKAEGPWVWRPASKSQKAKMKGDTNLWLAYDVKTGRAVGAMNP